MEKVTVFLFRNNTYICIDITRLILVICLPVTFTVSRFADNQRDLAVFVDDEVGVFGLLFLIRPVVFHPLPSGNMLFL